MANSNNMICQYLMDSLRTDPIPNFKRPDKPSACKWTANQDPANSPHSKDHLRPPMKIMPDILHSIGNTPLVRLHHIPQAEGIKCEMLAKCEFFNPGGSVKDRIGFRMVEDAEKQGLIKPGYTLIEPTSGNTGIGLALAAAVKGYKCIICMPEKMSMEKVDVLKALGATVIRTPTNVPFDAPTGLIAVAQKLQRKIPNSFILNQYMNPGNPLAHYDGTACEIYEQCGGKLDMVVIGAGTGGTVTGVARRLKELIPNVIVVGVDPVGSILAEPPELNTTTLTFYDIEGIGYDFNPTVLDKRVVDKWIKVTDRDCFPMARRLIREEGLLSGGSAGAAMYAALLAAKELKEGQRCVVVLPDGVRNYMTKFVDDNWMIARHFMPCQNSQGHWWWDDKVLALKLPTLVSIPHTATCATALALMKKEKFDQLPVTDDKGYLMGMATADNLMHMLVSSKIEANQRITKALVIKFLKATKTTILGFVSKLLEAQPYIVVTETEETVNDDEQKEYKEVVVGIVTIVDLLHYITSHEKPVPPPNGTTNGSEN